jgi:hypothetical protein
MNRTKLVEDVLGWVSVAIVIAMVLSLGYVIT